ncbi:hypothetical protein GALMADRAFT_148878 [Galerina marginata CBS 339.88]|uniref:Uncharacterized protein n=1 Tax=Galerina marginata (strain CBS 339.88) TaxID=685588 RepID=A0A067S306_GALM3|nr:hypothetical protein GALMADRAFT_148878 [Galerina marginata CBS 339.88]
MTTESLPPSAPTIRNDSNMIMVRPIFHTTRLSARKHAVAVFLLRWDREADYRLAVRVSLESVKEIGLMKSFCAVLDSIEYPHFFSLVDRLRLPRPHVELNEESEHDSSNSIDARLSRRLNSSVVLSARFNSRLSHCCAGIQPRTARLYEYTDEDLEEMAFDAVGSGLRASYPRRLGTGAVESVPNLTILQQSISYPTISPPSSTRASTTN